MYGTLKWLFAAAILSLALWFWRDDVVVVHRVEVMGELSDCYSLMVLLDGSETLQWISPALRRSSESWVLVLRDTNNRRADFEDPVHLAESLQHVIQDLSYPLCRERRVIVGASDGGGAAVRVAWISGMFDTVVSMSAPDYFFVDDDDGVPFYNREDHAGVPLRVLLYTGGKGVDEDTGDDLQRFGREWEEAKRNHVAVKVVVDENGKHSVESWGRLGKMILDFIEEKRKNAL